MICSNHIGVYAVFELAAFMEFATFFLALNQAEKLLAFSKIGV